MTGKDLTVRNMEIGDILLVEDFKDPTHFMIAVGQALVAHGTKASSNVTHAGIYDGAGNILEASGAAGLRSANFLEEHLGTKYQVYRYLGDKKIPERAFQWANAFVLKRGDEKDKNKGFGRYSTSGALSSLFRSSIRGPWAKKAIANRLNNPTEDRGFYCSSFVVECFELACNELGKRPVIEIDYRFISPKMLQANLRHCTDWSYVGNYTVLGMRY
jgi:hypothetical protein